MIHWRTYALLRFEELAHKTSPNHCKWNTIYIINTMCCNAKLIYPTESVSYVNEIQLTYLSRYGDIPKCTWCYSKCNLLTCSYGAPAVPNGNVYKVVFQITSYRRSTKGFTFIAYYWSHIAIDEYQQRKGVTVDRSCSQVGCDKTYAELCEDRRVHDEQTVRGRWW